MNIAKDNNQRSQCHKSLDTLELIFIHCPHTKAFTNILNSFIRDKLDLEFRPQG